jgi:uncharacterized protein YndB with AHSA1/START domain
MLKILGVVLCLVIVFVLIIAALASRQPSSYHVERSTVIAAPPARIMPFLVDFHHFKDWSPWEKLDPKMTTSFSGALSGPGAVYEWQGNSKAGAGRMEILSATPTEVVEKLDFLKPFKSSNTVTYTLDPESPASTNPATRVTWAMSGPAQFATRVMIVFSPMDKMIGPDFDRGLASLKAAAETQ